jgi:hypothetical protein
MLGTPERRRSEHDDALNSTCGQKNLSARLIIVESQPPFAQLLPQHTVLLAQIIDELVLALIHPAGQGHGTKWNGLKTLFLSFRHYRQLASAPINCRQFKQIQFWILRLRFPFTQNC